MSRHLQRILDNADRDESTGCLISRYSVGSHGYAQGWDGQKNVLCHRFVWEQANGHIPDGVTVDHVCHNKKCIELSHLRLLNNLDNARRNQPGRDWQIGYCAAGHSNSEHWRPAGSERKKGYCNACRTEKATGRTPPAGGFPRVRKYCKRGHELAGENVYIVPGTGRRQCRTCNRDRKRGVQQP